MVEPALQIENLYVSFFTLSGEVRAINGVNLEVYPGEFFGLVGETGCGKTVTGLTVLGLVPKPGRVTKGRILLNGRDLLSLPPREMHRVRGGDITMIFQNPATSLNPVFTVGSQLVRVIRLHRKISRRQAREQLNGVLDSILGTIEQLMEQEQRNEQLLMACHRDVKAELGHVQRGSAMHRTQVDDPPLPRFMDISH